MRYAHLARGDFPDAVNRGSLAGTVTKPEGEERETMQPGDYMVRPEGLEPPTLGSEVRCSIQLSYGRARVIRTMLPRGCQETRHPTAAFIARTLDTSPCRLT